MAENMGNSQQSLAEASRNRARFSGHGQALGAAGTTVESPLEDFLSAPGDVAVVNPHQHGYRSIKVAMAWDNVGKDGKPRGPIGKAAGKAARAVDVQAGGVDLDLGCLYELKDGERGVVQAFGNRFGCYDDRPFIALSGDEKTGDSPGDDEYLSINGSRWPSFKRILLYAYIYAGAPDWSTVRPRIQVRVHGERPLTVALNAGETRLAICAVAGLENVRDGIRMTNHLEFFPGHAEMDRAFGFGLPWQDGRKGD